MTAMTAAPAAPVTAATATAATADMRAATVTSYATVNSTGARAGACAG